MRSPWLSIIPVILGAVLVFVVPVLVQLIALPGEPLSLLVLSIVASGMITEAALTYWRDSQQRKSLQKELDESNRERCELYIEVTLARTIDFLKVPEKARAFIYLMEQGSKKFYVAFEHGMKGSPDYFLKFEKHEGWVGDVWYDEDHEQLAYDLSVHDPHDLQEDLKKLWNLGPTERKAILDSGVRSVLYTPILDPIDPNKVVIGVLGIDSTKPFTESRFDQKDVQDIAAWIAGSLGMHLRAGKIVA